MKTNIIIYAGPFLALLLNGCITDHVRQTPEENPASFQEIAAIDLGAATASEISAYDPATKRLFTVNNEASAIVDVMDLSALPTIIKLQPINVSAMGGVANSVAVSDGKLAIAGYSGAKRATYSGQLEPVIPGT